ncbi:ThuA domain-containing protein [Sanguibacter sp. 4.1]|uniref:ThuA domain-containing protein n=1 Tax=Sanguibacter biliveldensis TaxID=3030830 RepID=A0AAF0Z7C8_9MICO|nr:ThuA domain-containing protein [Sanguibacter sp. 4.1]WPF82241.1 ThuA domain-containing protein [Sanguibacter sp. 4.1]
MKITRPLRALVVVDGTDVHHDLLGAATALRDTVLEAGVVAEAAVGLDRFVDATPPTSEADVLVLYRSGVVFDPAQQQALSDRVAAGAGLVVLHASNLFGYGPGGLEADAVAHELFGSRYVSHGDHGSEGTYTVELTGEHPVTAFLDDFVVEDEFYVIETREDVRVLAERVDPDGVRHTVAYVRDHGRGRVCYVALGHDMRAWGSPYVRQVVRQAVLWAGGVDLADVETWSTRFPLGNGRSLGPAAGGGAR